MSRLRKSYESMLRNPRNLRFATFQRVVEAFGFRLDRVVGSHHIYVHPQVDRPLSLQSVQGEAKPYQIRQFIDIVETYGLRMDERS